MATNPELVLITVSAIDRFSEVFDILETRLDRIRKSTQGVQNALNSVGSQLAKQAKGFAVATEMIGRGVVVVAKFVGHSVDAADKVGDLAARYQISSRALQVYGSLLEDAGGSTDDAAKAMGQLRKSMNEAIAGDQQQQAAFAGVGLGVEELKRLAPDEVMLRMADAFKSSERAGQKNAVLLKVMGEEGTLFMDAMNQGSAAYHDRMVQMQADGTIFSREQIAQADKFDKSWSRLVGTLASVGNALGIKLAGALVPLVDRLQQWVAANRGLIEQKFDVFLERLPVLLEDAQRFMAKLVVVFEFATSAFGRGILTFFSVAGSVMQLTKSIIMFIQILPVVVNLLKFVWGVLAANPIAAIIMVVTGLAMVVYNNFDAIVGYISAAWDRITSVFEIGFFDGLFQLWLEGWQGFGNTIIGLIKAITPEFLLPDSLKNFELTFATDRKKRLDSGEEKSLAQLQLEQQQQPHIKERNAVLAGQKPLRGRGVAPPSGGSIFTATEAAKVQGAVNRQAIENTIRLQIDSDGRAKVKDVTPGSPNTKINVMTGPLNMGGL